MAKDKDEKPLSQELAAARADNPPPMGMKGYLEPGDAKAMDRAAKIAIKALEFVNRRLILRKPLKETRDLVLLAQLELAQLYE